MRYTDVDVTSLLHWKFINVGHTNVDATFQQKHLAREFLIAFFPIKNTQRASRDSLQLYHESMFRVLCTRLEFAAPKLLSSRLSAGFGTMSQLFYGKRLTGKVAVVTASSDGIGFAIAERLAQEGAKVVVSSRKSPNVEKAVAQLKAKDLQVFGVKCHVGNAEDRKNLFAEAEKRFGGIDILVSNAAANPEMATLFECSEAAWEKIFEINVKCSFLLTKEVVPYMRKRGGGSIIYVSSIAGFNPMQLLAAYSVSKTALFGLTKAAAIDGAAEGIRVNCVAPGVIETKFSQPLIQDPNSKEVAENQTLLRRIGQPHEISGVVAFLASDDSSYITGENIVAAGGMHSRL